MISVIIPTRNNSSDLKNCLISLLKQNKKPNEIIVVFDSKHDKNIQLARKFGIKTAIDKDHTIGGAYFAGVKIASGDVIAFIDDDCVAPNDWIMKIEEEFKEDIDVVCGEDVVPENSSAFQKAAYQIDKARALKTPLYGEKAKNRLRAANIAYRKQVFEKENFNTKLKGLQEPEFHHRIFKRGFKMKFDPNLYVYHKRRNSLRGVFKQIYRNGKAKIDVIKLHRDMLSFIDLAPFAYIFFTLVMIYSSLKSGVLFFYLWLGLTIGYFLLKPLIILVKTHELKYYRHLVSIVFVREVAYSIGILVGLKNLLKRKI